MGVLDFLIPTLKAAESYAKLKADREYRKMQELHNLSYEQRRRVTDKMVELYADSYDEHLVESQYKSRHIDPRPHQYKSGTELFVLEGVLKQLPSYDAGETVANAEILKENAHGWGRYIALASLYGKMPKKVLIDTRFSAQYKIKAEEWVGRRATEYKPQILHEFLTYWHNTMKEKGFPFDIKLVNTIDKPVRKMYKTGDGKVITEEPLFRAGNIYYWELPMCMGDTLAFFPYGVE